MKIKTISFLFIIAIFSISVFAQKSTPETNILTPSDTTKTKPPADVKPEPEQPKIELPDVLILGKDQYHRTVKDKKELTPETPAMMRRETSYEAPSAWFSSETNKPQLSANDSLAVRQLWGKLRGGSFYTFDGDAGYWQKLSKGDAMGAFWFDRSEGQFTNTKYAQGGLSGKVSYEAAPNAVGIARAEYNRYMRGLHTSAFAADNTVRTAGSGLFAADLQYDINTLSDGNIGFEIGGVSMSSDTSSETIDRTDNFYYDVHFDYTTQLKKTQLTARGQYVHETLEASLDSSSGSSSFSTLGVQVLHPLSNVLTAAFGADYHIFNQDSLYSKSRISPFARINIMAGDQLGISLQLSTGLRYETFMQHWESNYYLSHTLPIRPSEERIGLALKGDIKITDKIKFQAGYSRRWMDEMFYWQADTTNGLLALNQVSDADLNEIQIGATVKLSDKTHLQITYIDYADEIGGARDSLLSNLNRLPYRADFRMPIRASIQLLPELNLTLTVDVVGNRKKNINSEETLPSYGLFHADMTAKINKNVSAMLSVRNLLDAKYTVWQGYPEMGVVVVGGLRARF
jgi:outer membrane receptor protein involved in Fe transport